MPVRAKVEKMLIRQFVGTVSFQFGEPQNISQPEFGAVVEFSSNLYARIVERIDWPQIMLEAAACCRAHEHERGIFEDFCPGCLETALLMYDRPFDSDWTTSEVIRAKYPPRGWHLPEWLRTAFAGWAVERDRSMSQSSDTAVVSPDDEQ